MDYVREERKYAHDHEGQLKRNFIATYLEPSGHPLARRFGKLPVGLSGSFLYLKRTPAAR